MYIKPIEELTFADDFVFGKIMHDKEICKKVLECLLKTKIREISYPQLQKEIRAYYNVKGIRMDVYFEGDDKLYDIEIQTQHYDDLGLRTRFYQSMIDCDNLMKGGKYSDLKESIIIFICRKSPFNADLPEYTFTNVCKESRNVVLNDKCTKKFFNAEAYEKSDCPEIRAFLKFVNCYKPDDSLTDSIYNQVEKLKENDLFHQEYMRMSFHDYDIQREAMLEAKLQDAENFLKLNIPLETVQKATGLSDEQLKPVLEKLNIK